MVEFFRTDCRYPEIPAVAATERYLASWLCCVAQEDGPAQRQYRNMEIAALKMLEEYGKGYPMERPQAPDVFEDDVVPAWEDVMMGSAVS